MCPDNGNRTPYVFIGFCAQELPIADALERLLTKSGIACKKGPLGLPEDHPLRSMINAMMEGAVCILLLHPDAVYVDAALQNILSSGKHFFSIGPDAPDLLNGYHYELVDGQITATPFLRENDPSLTQTLEDIYSLFNISDAYTSASDDLPSAGDTEIGEQLVSIFRSLKVQSTVARIDHGPSFTRYSMEIKPGISLNRITKSLDTLPEKLGFENIRTEVPIPGTPYVGIEIPNKTRIPVTLNEMAGSDSSEPVEFPLGKDVTGAAVRCDLKKMPHLLIAGSAGSGKTVCLNNMICSLANQNTPDTLRMILIDIPQAEFSCFNTLPHLLTPVIGDPDQAYLALEWCINEMFARYSLFSEAKVRNMCAYNELQTDTENRLPYIVIVINELEPLMRCRRRDTEDSIRRMAALARAAGIHMVVAAQRPSPNVITGTIKNNIPSRIAFSLPSNYESRSLLDIGGAEKLLGMGDMLYKRVGTTPVRVQGCILSEEEINHIVNDLAGRYKIRYAPDLQEVLENGHGAP